IQEARRSDDPSWFHGPNDLPPAFVTQPDKHEPNKQMSVQIYGCNHVAIEVGDIEKAIAFYEDVFDLKKLDEGEGDAFFKLGEHQFLAMFERKGMEPVKGNQHFGIMVRDEEQLAAVRDKLTGKYGIKLI